MSELRQRMTEDLRLAGYAERTIASYVGTVKCLSKYYGRSPDTLNEAEIRQYFVYLIQERQAARSTVTQHLTGIKFFY